jgi:choline dehydrogenase-like flavoprotein
LQLDARKLTNGTMLSCDICVIGAGPAGISIALELEGCGADVLLIESGGTADELRIQELNEGQVVGDSYAGLRATRHRGLAGTVNLWNTEVGGGAGAKYAPLDPRDLDPSPADVPLPGWPLEYATLERYYRRAQTVCGLGPFAYGASDWESPERAAWRLSSNSALTSSVYQFGPGRLFTTDYVNVLRSSNNVRLCDHATLVSLTSGPHGGEFEAQVRVTTTDATISVRARLVVLAAGAIENARLLLVCANTAGSTLGKSSKWAGRCFMEHPRDKALILSHRSPEFVREARFYDAYTGPDGVTTCGRLALRPRAARASQCANLSVSLVPDVPAPGPFSRFLHRAGMGRKRLGYGWSQLPDSDERLARFQLLINLEQRPRPENRVVLSATRDIYGVPRAELHWRWSDVEQSQLEAARKLIAADIEAAGLGTIELRRPSRPDPNAHHHAGTTRMADDDRWGVVDNDCRVHGTENLYVAGASVFPIAGSANPTLTIVALAIRLADHLRHRV